MRLYTFFVSPLESPPRPCSNPLPYDSLQVLVFVGALLYVFSKGAKFSLFKPAEEMVYIGLDKEGRTKGKAAIDVVGAQTGKSTGSFLQQVSSGHSM